MHIVLIQMQLNWKKHEKHANQNDLLTFLSKRRKLLFRDSQQNGVRKTFPRRGKGGDNEERKRNVN